jgi:hypothetical protein
MPSASPEYQRPSREERENHLLVIAAHLLDDFQPFPVNAIDDFLRPFQRQLPSSPLPAARWYTSHQ